MLINNREFTIGADPELFIAKDGKPHSAYGLIPGTKSRPSPVKHGAVQVDGMALEFNIDPATDMAKFLENIETVKQQLLDLVPGYDIVQSCSVVFDQDHFDQQPDEAKALGCDPDYNGWTKRQVTKPDGNTTMRCAGGHVHIGGFFKNEYEESLDHFYDCCRLATIMDQEVGVYSLLWDNDDKRRSMYGQAGAFRPKAYGMEYRTMSNAWIFNPRLIELVYEFSMEAVEKMFDDDYVIDPVVASIINTSDRSAFEKNIVPYFSRTKYSRVVNALGG